MEMTTETQYAVDDLRAGACATCVLCDYNQTPCRHLRAYRLYRDVPAEWVFDETGAIACEDWFAAPPSKN